MADSLTTDDIEIDIEDNNEHTSLIDKVTSSRLANQNLPKKL